MKLLTAEQFGTLLAINALLFVQKFNVNITWKNTIFWAIGFIIINNIIGVSE